MCVSFNSLRNCVEPPFTLLRDSHSRTILNVQIRACCVEIHTHKMDADSSRSLWWLIEFFTALRSHTIVTETITWMEWDEKDVWKNDKTVKENRIVVRLTKTGRCDGRRRKGWETCTWWKTGRSVRPRRRTVGERKIIRTKCVEVFYEMVKKYFLRIYQN